MNAPADSSAIDVLALEGPLNVTTVEIARQRIVAALDGAATVQLDLAAVDDVDVYGLQLLHAAQRSACSRGKRLGLLHSPACLAAACERAAIDPTALGHNPATLPT